ncbi:MAG: alpha-galactosidase [Deltaproteobacteria bacterium]|jgi:alpha-galactosidase|nr:alpha-galactosidase [Deltaproteobacteria bacterium]
MMQRPLASSTPDARGARILPLHVAVCTGESGGWEERAHVLSSDVLRFADGALDVILVRHDHGEAATLDVSIMNAGADPLRVQAVELAFDFLGHEASSLRFLRHGWQSWSFTGTRALDEAGEPAFPSGPWLRGMYHCVGVPGPRREGWHESEIVSLVGASGGGPAALVGVLETGSAFGIVYLRPGGLDAAGERSVRIVAELRAEIVLEPGARRDLESVRVAVGSDANALLERFAELWGERAGARRDAIYRSGWCSWYHFFRDVNEDDLLRNLDAMVSDRSGIPISLIQLDDGYQRTIGDWLHTNEKFPRGLAPIAQAIREAGFEAGIWTAPFAASAESRVLVEHPDWALKHGDHWQRGTLNPDWSADGWVYALDTSRTEVLGYLEGVFRELAAIGFTYQKLDFLYMACMEAGAHDPAQTRAERLRAGLLAIRRGAGTDAFLLGCGCPLGPAVGVVDGMRIGPDVAPCWDMDQPRVIPGLERVLPSTRSAIRSILNRVFMHRRLWLNDPDCLMVRGRQTRLLPHEARSLADVIALTGGMTLFSDDVALLGDAERRLVREVVELGREVDAIAPRGSARLIDPLGSDDATRVVTAGVGRDALLASVNMSEGPVTLDFALGAQGLMPGPHTVEPLHAAARAGERAPEQSAVPTRKLIAHESAACRIAPARDWVVFCDFDGTFSVQDVGSTLVRARLPERRAELWQRYEDGEFDAWEYYVELFSGFDCPREEVDAFLGTIDLDPGASELVAWCAKQAVPLRILSDGFDYNLERLQAIYDIPFEYASNHLEFEGTQWRIEPGGRNPDCGCGTGCCKRAKIDAWRAAHPGAFCVHVGNGRVSDLCGALAADLVFAKDSLAPALSERGVHHHPFETLADVVAELERRRSVG